MVLIFNSILSSINYNFLSYSYPNFLQLIAGLERIIFYGFRFWLSYFGQPWGYGQVTQADFLLIWRWGFLGRVMSLVFLTQFWLILLIFRSLHDGKVGKGWNWLIIWMEFSLFNFYTLGITVTAKSHWFPQLLPVICKCYFWNVCLGNIYWTFNWLVPKSFNFSHILFIIIILMIKLITN